MDLLDALKRPIPRTPSELLEMSLVVWQCLSRAVLTFRERSAEDASALASGLCRWRYTVGLLKWRSDDDLSAVYVVEAGMRLALLDWIHERDNPASIAKTVVRAHRLADSERAACSQPFSAIRANECEAYARSVSGSWTHEGTKTRESDQLAVLAHALLIVVGGQESLPSSSHLISASRLGILATQRAMLRDIAQCDDSPAPLNSKNVRAWVAKRIAAQKSEAATKGHSEAVALDDMDPLSLPSDDLQQGFSAIAVPSAVAFLLTLQPPDVATRAAMKAKDWTSPKTDRQWTIVSLSIFDYACRQAHGYHWASAFTTSDARPAAALERIRRYLNERMARPPPLLLVIDSECVLLHKSGSRVAPLGRYKGTDGLAAWVLAAESSPSISSRIPSVLRDAGTAMESETVTEQTMPLIPIM